MMNDVYVRDVVYDTISHCFINITYTTKEQADAAMLDSLSLLPIRLSDDSMSTNVYRLKNDKNKIIKIRYKRSHFRTIDNYKTYIDAVLEAHGRSRDELILVKKIVDKGLYRRILELAKTREQIKLLDVYKFYDPQQNKLCA